MKWPHILVALAVLVTGCATGRVAYTKPGVSDAERKRDQAECVQASLDHSSWQPHILLLVTIDREAFVKCIEGRGYSAVQQ